MSTHQRLWLVGVAASFALAACSSDAVQPRVTPVETSRASTAVQATSDCTLGDGSVSLDVLSPSPNEVAKGPTLALFVQAEGYRMDARYAGTPDLPDVGHYHEILDGRLVDMTPVRDAQRDVMSLVDVAPGPHVLTLVPACDDHTMVMSAAVDVPFDYAGPYLPPPAANPSAGPPTIAIVSPPEGATVQGGAFDMSVSVSNFALCGDCFGKSNIDGVGHWHIFVDTPTMAHMKTMAGGPTQSVSLTGIPQGWHTFWAVLVNDQHMPFMGMPSTMASVDLFVQSAN